jgi:hypothetical protein
MFSPSISINVPIKTAPRASSPDAAKIVAPTPSRNFFALIANDARFWAAGNGGYSSGGKA